MAILDRRLLPFIEMLAELGMDWLAFELVDGIRRGDEPTETQQVLALARDQIGDPAVDEFERHTSPDSEVTSFLGDDQLEWAMDYTFERLRATLAEMSYSLEALDELLDDRKGGHPAASQVEALLVLLEDGGERAVSRAQVEAAQARLPELRAALHSWRRGTTLDPD